MDSKEEIVSQLDEYVEKVKESNKYSKAQKYLALFVEDKANWKFNVSF